MKKLNSRASKKEQSPNETAAPEATDDIKLLSGLGARNKLLSEINNAVAGRKEREAATKKALHEKLLKRSIKKAKRKVSKGVNQRLDFANVTEALKEAQIEALGQSVNKKFACEVVVWFDTLLTNKDFSSEELGRRTVLQETIEQRLKPKLKTELATQFSAALLSLNIPADEADNFFDEVKAKAYSEIGYSCATTPDEKKTNLENAPTAAPELYRDRKDRKEKPDAFIRRVYAAWLGPEDAWPRKLLSDLDPPLYLATSRYGLSDELDGKLYKTAGRPRKTLSEKDLPVLERKRARDRRATRRYQLKK